MNTIRIFPKKWMFFVSTWHQSDTFRRNLVTFTLETPIRPVFIKIIRKSFENFWPYMPWELLLIIFTHKSSAFKIFVACGAGNVGFYEQQLVDFVELGPLFFVKAPKNIPEKKVNLVDFIKRPIFSHRKSKLTKSPLISSDATPYHIYSFLIWHRFDNFSSNFR